MRYITREILRLGRYNFLTLFLVFSSQCDMHSSCTLNSQTREERHYLREKFLKHEDSLRVAHEFATKAIKWDKKPPSDTVNQSVFKTVFNVEKKINMLRSFLFLHQLYVMASGWMLEIFGKEIPLFEGFICKYDHASNVKGPRSREGML